MWLEKLRIVQFKNHSKTELNLQPGWVCITGSNGVGKTTILDAIWFLANSRSYFTTVDQQLIQHEQSGFSLKAQLKGSDEFDISCRLEAGKRKQLTLNEVPVKKLSSYIGTLPVVMITPSDIEWVGEGSEIRRRFVDMALCKVYPTYLQALDTYKKALESRNKQLKWMAKNDSKDPLLLSAFDAILIENAPILFGYRKQFVEELKTHFAPLYQSLSGDKEKADIFYESHLQERDMAAWLQLQKEKDTILERTTKGPHLDDLNFQLNSYPVKKYASQGQTKSFVIALQLALFCWLRDKKNKAPLLLLDDIYEKIDGKRIEALMKLIETIGPEQVFITDTHKERVEQNLEGFVKEKQYIDLT